MSKQIINVVETCRVAGSASASASASEQVLPLTFFDLTWLQFHPIRRLLFYDVPASCSSQTYFFETLVPKLKHSLSLALGHYFPLAGCLAYPDRDEEKPIIRCTAQDSVSVTVAVADELFEFNKLVGNHPRDADQFYDFIPQLQPATVDQGKLLLAVQVTLFPGRGICVGIANHHVVGDATSVVGFIRSWATICRHELAEAGNLSLPHEFPLFDRSVIHEPPGVNDIYWNLMKQVTFLPSSFPSPTHRVRATFVLRKPDIDKLKGLLLGKMPGFVHASSFVVTAAYVWTCLGKSLVAAGDYNVDGDAEEFFLFAVDARARLDPPVPDNYFGNCLGFGLGKLRHRELVGGDGFFLAAEAVAREIREWVNRKEKVLDGVEGWIEKIMSAVQKRTLAVSGSTKVDLYGDGDFGWGKPRKLETLSIDGEKYALSMCRSGEFDGGLEVGLSLPDLAMDAFALAFSDGLV